MEASVELGKYEIDLLVIGGGTAGIVGAKTATQLGARTILVESSRTGGDCLWTGCVPSKTLLAAAARAATEHVLTGNRTDFSAVRTRIASAIAAIEPDDSPQALESAGATVVAGTARFTGPGTAEIDGRPISFRQALIATGSAPSIPPIPGLEAARVVTSETIWDLEEQPRRLVVVGGGPIGCELGQAFARLGTSVTLISRSRILPREIPDAADLIRGSLTSDGVTVIEDDGVEKVTVDADDTSTVHTTGGLGFEADVVLLATGRQPRTKGLGLDTVDVQCGASGHVLVDNGMRSSNPNIWAAGDVTESPDFTHLAAVHASVASSNAVLGLRRTVSTTIPRVTYTSPEVGAVGITDSTSPEYTTSTIHHSDGDRAITENEIEGMTQLVIDKRGRIVGGTIVGPRAGESLGELTLAVQQRLRTRDLAGVTHPYPTYNDALWNAATAHARSSLEGPLVKAGVGVLVRFNRWRKAHKPLNAVFGSRK
ncbi:dihydrolipoyl dehydrogenase family protein [Arthrobacter roseus]|uniref:dihydrolipoyl dehydrogenase family protein n=1 Tax=Arthrobacter roseus TaxID=136274 RepID=UPI00196254EB|nr:NAD(P)/FAD-dependent oxidoreductase [Arthrobacter roseus]MBM7846821.1 pyruvate/2-oxoglutarate dehydrogenase complex dihydrolipoamide dehydrogenase (E3) component [Arthrobacter roseus]